MEPCIVGSPFPALSEPNVDMATLSKALRAI